MRRLHTPWLGLMTAAILASCGGSASSGDPAKMDLPPGTPGGPPAPPQAGTDYVIVAADTLSASAQRFKTYRESTGHIVAMAGVHSIVGDETATPAAVTKIHDYVKARFDARDPKKPFFVLIIGDADASAPVDSAHVPAGIYNAPDGSTISTDNLYADMDGDNVPDLAVGRIAVSSDADVDIVLDKTKRYASSHELGAWNRRLNLFASTSGFGEPFDTQIETLVFKIVEEIPYDYDLSLTYAKQSSPFVYVPEHFSDKVYERLNEGSLMMAYVGHGSEDSFADLVWNGGSFPIFDTSHIAQIKAAHRPPLLTLIACLTGAFATSESLSEKVLKTPDGPVAILSSTEISHPYANAIFIRELAQALTTSPDATVGELFIDAKKRMVTNNDALRQDIDAQVGMLVLPEQRATLKQTHLYMYTLFGDPAAPIARPKSATKVTAAAKVAPGASLAVTASLPLGKGTALVTLESKRSSPVTTVEPVPADGTATRDAVIAANYAKANDRVVAKATASHDGGALSATLAIPADLAAGEYHLKVYADDGTAEAIGSATVTVGP